jgi:hypothetical protein
MHVITAVNASIYGAAGHPATDYNLFIDLGAASYYAIPEICLLPGSTAQEVGTIAWTGELAGPLGAQIGAYFGAPGSYGNLPADTYGWLEIQGYDQ